MKGEQEEQTEGILGRPCTVAGREQGGKGEGEEETYLLKEMYFRDAHLARDIGRVVNLFPSKLRLTKLL
jgi:hypothetical protein